MTDLDHEFNPHRDEDYMPLRPRPRTPERVGKPLAAQHEDLRARMAQIVDEIIERDRMPDGRLRWR